MPEDTPQVQVTTPNKTSWKKIGLTVLIILVVTGLLAGVYWYFVMNKESDTPDLTGPVPKPNVSTATPSATSSTQKDETDKLTIYKNTKYKYSFKIPSGFFVLESGKEITNLNQISEAETVSLIPTKYRNDFKLGHAHLPSIHIEIADIEGLSLENWLGKYSTTAANYPEAGAIFIDVENKTTRKVDGRDALQFQGNHATSADELVVLIKGSNKVYQIHATISLSSEDLSDSLDKILSTFKFLD